MCVWVHPCAYICIYMMHCIYACVYIYFMEEGETGDFQIVSCFQYFVCSFPLSSGHLRTHISWNEETFPWNTHWFSFHLSFLAGIHTVELNTFYISRAKSDIHQHRTWKRLLNLTLGVHCPTGAAPGGGRFMTICWPPSSLLYQVNVLPCKLLLILKNDLKDRRRYQVKHCKLCGFVTTFQASPWTLMRAHFLNLKSRHPNPASM